MAKVHFVKEGKRPNGDRITVSAEVSASIAAEKLGAFDSRYAKTPPTINPEMQASDYAEFKHVVLEVEQGESAPPFQNPGFYYIVGLTPTECKRLLGLPAPSV